MPGVALADLLGQPYGPGGCWSLAREAYARLNGITPPDWPVAADGNVNHARVLEAIAAQYETLAAPQPGCFVVFRTPIGPHIGVVVDKYGRFIHVLRACKTSIEKLSAPEWRHRIVGFYKLKA